MYISHVYIVHYLLDTLKPTVYIVHYVLGI